MPEGADIMKQVAKKATKKIALGTAIGCLPMFLIVGGIVFVIVIIGGILSPIEANTVYMNDAGISSKYGEKKTENWAGFKDSDPTKATFYKKLAKLAKRYEDDYGIQLDVALISSIVFYGDFVDPGDTDFDCEEEIVVDEEGNETSGDCVKDSSTGKVSATKLYKEAKKVAEAMVNDGILVTDDEFKVWLKENFIEDKLKSLDVEIPEDKDIKNSLFDRTIDEIYQFRDIYVEITYGFDESGVNTVASCDYKIGDKLVRNVKVELLSCDGKKVLETVDFEKYIKGVVMAENRGAPDEGIKVQAIVARSFALTRQNSMCPGNPDNCSFGYNAEKNVVRMRSCENDQAYCDPDKGCTITEAINEEGIPIHTWVQGKHKGRYIAPLEGEAKKRFDRLIDSVSGVTATDSNGSVVYTNYTNVDQNAWTAMANVGKKYDQIIKEHYKKAGVTSLTSSCSATDDIIPGVKFPIAEKFYSEKCYSAGICYDPSTKKTCDATYHGAIDFSHNALFAGRRPESDQIRIVASTDGTVITAGSTTVNTYPACMGNTKLKNDGLGYYIKVDDKNSKYYGYTFVYWHLSQMNPKIKVGSKVKQGDYLGLMGNTGCSSGKHLHYQVLDSKGQPVILDRNVDKYCKDHVTKE